MSEGFRPRIRYAPDAPKATGITNPGELPPRHPSETFPWPDRESYFQQRDAFTSAFSPFLPLITQRLEGDKHYAYRDNPEITRTAAALFSRALFDHSLMESNNPTSSNTPINPNTINFENSRLGAITIPVFTLGEHEIGRDHLLQLAPKDVEQLKLKEILILFNMNRLGRHIQMIEDAITEGIMERGDPVDFAEAWKTRLLDHEGIEQERIMVEEMAHAVYIIHAASNPESLGEYIEEERKYPQHALDSDEPLSAEEAPGYIDSPMEKDGEKWVDQFMQRYYPDVKYEHLAQREK